MPIKLSMPRHPIFFETDWLSPERLRRVALAWLAAATLAGRFSICGRKPVPGSPTATGNNWARTSSITGPGAILAADGMAPEFTTPALRRISKSHTGAHANPNGHYTYPPMVLLISRPLAVMAYIAAFDTGCGRLAGCAALFKRLGLAYGRTCGLRYAGDSRHFLNIIAGQNGHLTAALLCGGS